MSAKEQMPRLTTATLPVASTPPHSAASQPVAVAGATSSAPTMPAPGVAVVPSIGRQSPSTVSRFCVVPSSVIENSSIDCEVAWNSWRSGV